MAIRGIGDFVTLLALADAESFVSLLQNLAAVLGVTGVILLLLGLGVRWNKENGLGMSEKLQLPPLVCAVLLIGTAVGLNARGSAPGTNVTEGTSPAAEEPPGITGLVQLPSPSPPHPVSGSGFGFDEGIMGWVAERRGDSRAVVEVGHWTASADGATSGLRLAVDLAGGDPTRAKGEAWAELPRPYDLRGRHLVATVYAPPEARGDPSDPNGFQVFVKDASHRALYGPYTRVRPGQWMDVELTVSDSAPETGWMREGFDPSRITTVGVKIAAGGNSTARYHGPIYLDALSW